MARQPNSTCNFSLSLVESSLASWTPDGAVVLTGQHLVQASALLFIISSLNLYFAGEVQRGMGTHVSWVEPLLVGTGVSWGVSLWVKPLPLGTHLCTVLVITA